jgi:hypothetical protein
VFALFSSVCRLRRPLIGAAVAALALTFAAPVLTAAPAAISKAPKPGVAGAAITLASHVDIDDGSYDIAVDGAGTAYVGWIADLSHTNTASRTVYLCVLPLHARACKGGIHSTASLDMSGASDLKVLVTKGGRASMVWFDNVLPDAENGPEGGQITETTLQPNGTLSDAQFVAAAPSFGEMLDAELGPNGSIWTVAAGSEAVDKIQVHEGLSSSPISIKTPFGVDYARLAFNGTKPIIVIHKAGAITEPVAFSDLSSGSWTKFANVARTWTSDANFGLTSSKFGVRLIATVNNADYYPVVAKWNGHGFHQADRDRGPQQQLPDQSRHGFRCQWPHRGRRDRGFTARDRQPGEHDARGNRPRPDAWPHGRRHPAARDDATWRRLGGMVDRGRWHCAWRQADGRADPAARTAPQRVPARQPRQRDRDRAGVLHAERRDLRGGERARGQELARHEAHAQARTQDPTRGSQRCLVDAGQEVLAERHSHLCRWRVALDGVGQPEVPSLPEAVGRQVGVGGHLAIPSIER